MPTGGDSDARVDRVLTIPNAVTAARLAAVPVFLWLLFGEQDRLAAAVVLAVLGATDWIDGWLARRLGQVSTLGKVLDPVADRVLLGVGVTAIMVDGSVPLWLGATVLAREALVSAAVVTLAALGAARIDVVWVGKAGTFGMMCAFPLFLVAGSSASWRGAAHVAAWVFAIPALALSWYAAGTYIPLARGALARGRPGRSSRGKRRPGRSSRGSARVGSRP
ncbi:MAG TPA: CDP-alcohol phosphatidyltransferase family protein [Acidimicrobiales bacterium]|jgi:cardiolipin synthase|nr:CDP-alcohol phosphatidyltransferase family protein [Acidimicrobiales bacterium]